MNWLSSLQICWPAVLCVFITGCYDTKQEITLNPDGSGKIVMESTFVQPELLLKRQKPNAPPERVRQLVEDAKGVDAWRDISFRELEDGRLWVRGTAYFRDLSKFQTSLNSFLNFGVTKHASGGFTLTLRPETTASPFTMPELKMKPNEPETMESIQLQRKQFRAAQPWLAATFGGIKQETVFRFPGVVKAASNFQTNGPQSLRFSYDGGRIVTAIERILFDPELTQRRLAAGSLTNFLSSDEVNEQLYGQRGPLRAVLSPGKKPLFDYAAEVEEARKSFSAMARELGLTEPPTERTKPAVDGAPARIKVLGVGWRFEKEEELVSLFGGPRQGYTLSLRAELPGAVFSVNEVSMTRAATLEGVLLESKARASGIGVEDPSGVRTNVSLDIHLGSPPIDSKGLAEVSGVLECSSAENRRTVELISGRLSAGAKGVEFGAHLDHVGSNNAGSEKLVLRTSLEPGRLLSLYVMNDAGMKVTLDIRGTMKVDKEYSYTCATRHSIPRSGKLIADALVGSQTLRIPFSVTNLTLLGQPLAAN